MADKEDNLVRRDGGPFSEKDFFQNPGEYKSVFFEKVNSPRLHVCIYNMCVRLQRSDNHLVHVTCTCM